ncbi:hypothetical protein [Ruminiclostridium cellobioparum]|uniref:hypothetical protein n=1 Tax=Ruminiclostridium cellobioparum TaxID=29355 RepID=UPI0028AA127D|nr:hypothetical protein [Ruminiclostridium cellobioparum]
MKVELREGSYSIIKCVNCKRVMMIIDSKVIGRVELKCNRCGAVSYSERLDMGKYKLSESTPNKKSMYAKNRQGIEFLINED